MFSNVALGVHWVLLLASLCGHCDARAVGNADAGRSSATGSSSNGCEISAPDAAFYEQYERLWQLGKKQLRIRADVESGCQSYDKPLERLSSDVVARGFPGNLSTRFNGAEYYRNGQDGSAAEEMGSAALWARRYIESSVTPLEVENFKLFYKLQQVVRLQFCLDSADQSNAHLSDKQLQKELSNVDEAVRDLHALVFRICTYKTLNSKSNVFGMCIGTARVFHLLQGAVLRIPSPQLVRLSRYAMRPSGINFCIRIFTKSINS